MKVTTWKTVAIVVSVAGSVFFGATLAGAQCTPSAQSTETKQDGAVVQERRLVLNPDEVVMLNETGSILVFQDNGLKVLIDPLPADDRMAAYREVDLQEGDIIMMINGKSIKSANDAKSLMDGLAIGEDIKMGVKRGQSMHMVSFPKVDPDEVTGPRPVIKTGSCGPGESFEVIGELGLMLIHKDGVVRVDELLLTEADAVEGMTLLKEDIIQACNGNKVTSATQFAELIAGIGVGDKVNLTVSRGEQTVELSFVKPEASDNVMTLHKQVK